MNLDVVLRFNINIHLTCLRLLGALQNTNNVVVFISNNRNHNTTSFNKCMCVCVCLCGVIQK